MNNIDKPTYVATVLLLAVFFGIVFHAPLSVFFGQFFDSDIIKAWKEIVLLVTLPIVIYTVWRAKTHKSVIHDRLLQLMAVYIGLYLLFALFSHTSEYQKIAGLMIDLRYIVLFVLVFCLVSTVPKLKKVFLKITVVAACMSIGFALLQATVLPRDILTHIGYSQETITPYLTVDKNDDYTRINGTLRGPNPLGAYIVILFSLLTAWVIRNKKTAQKNKWLIAGVAVVLATVAWATYSRSALLALVISVSVLLYMYLKKYEVWTYVAAAIIVFATIGSIFLFRSSEFVQNVVLHNNPDGGSQVDSNDDHARSIEQGWLRALDQPYGAGIGSTGSASLKSQQPIIIENQYLFVAHETGWFGLGLFAIIYTTILARLYNCRRDWLSLGLFASGIGLAIIGLFLPVWSDDTVSMIWFGLAAVAIAAHTKKAVKHGKKTN